MHFKRLEIVGFKSFAKKTVLEIGEGVTAIVGPNGCGKSNIAEAIKWVLGEQSARQLRGQRMEDVIFNGTTEQGPMGLAEVALTLNNEQGTFPVDYPEVTVTRRLFRSGESEYLINGNPVRLRDVQNLLMGTGMGTSAYSIFEQGKMDRVLSSRPEERREVFEEASGITRFKVRRREAERKLEETEQNLLRISDIVTEVQRQIKSLERQAKRARTYREEFDQLKELELKLAVRHLHYWQGSAKKLENQLIELRAEVSSTDISINKMHAQRDELRIQADQTAQEWSRIRDLQREKAAESESCRRRAALDRERCRDLENRSQALSGELEVTLSKKSEFESHLENVLHELEACSRTEQEQRTRVAQTQSQQKECEGWLDVDRREIQTKLKEIERLEGELERLNEKRNQQELDKRALQLSMERLGLERQRVVDQIGPKETESAERSEAYRQISAELQEGVSEQESLERSAREAGEKGRRLDQEFEDLNRRQGRLEMRLQHLRDLKERKEGYSSGAKAVLSGELEGIRGSVANLIEVTSGYEIPIETALRERVQCIVVERSAVAKQAIKYLRQEQKGRASFLALDKVPTIEPLSIPPDWDGKCVRATDVVWARPEHFGVVSWFLQNVFITEDWENAEALAACLPAPTGYSGGKSDWMILTRDGDSLEGTILSGGFSHVTEDTSLLRRDAVIREVTAESEEVAGQLSQVKIARESSKEHVEKLSEKIRANSERIRRLGVTQAQRQQEFAGSQAELNRLKEQILGFDAEWESANKKLQEVDEMLSRSGGYQSQSQGVLEGHRAEIQERRQAIERNSSLLERLRGESAELNAELKIFEERRVALFQTQKVVEESLKSGTDRAQTLQVEMGSASERYQELQRSSQELDARSLELDREAQELEEKAVQISLDRQRLTENAEEAEQVYETKRAERDSLQERIHGLEIQMQDCVHQLESVADRVRQQYQLDLIGLVQSPDAEERFAWAAEENEAQVENEVHRLRKRIEGLGPVNLVAIEEHEEQVKRYEFLNSQYEDLIKSKDSLNKAIREINQTTKELFTEAFEKIRVEFRKLFRVLFGGGDAQLVLVDPENVLESGIEIIASPPGKKLQSVSLLSGGERAMTAIALLLAIFKVKPSPFCIMDEIDAPLDEANVDRFCQILKEFVQQSQFIIVTHNKRTISMADFLYGVTMENQGVSKIVSVRLKSEGVETETGRAQETVTLGGEEDIPATDAAQTAVESESESR
ncbi:MAG: chromosome segregation protein SMC [Candidatus Omnitrophica bacterium]|nr:chromosome segregation protein SMC [Candidatus Omnitrophota bacterium]